ncbi:hypothetical protein [Kutzneria albida]|uniref:Uncharacterized protein n=1 Tax=Kutzneria albida DSM 43870 TaxID=1449976 RepID=W5WJH2_9PSEU|nr:hypothetical protein [Kutzneria albida]AHH98314.1 hypothetical protein KALB_4952 [Kutzneria albida DSM 43870]
MTEQKTPPMRTWQLTYFSNGGNAERTKVHAAYFSMSGEQAHDLLQFKDSDNKVVFAVPKRLVVTIRRIDEQRELLRGEVLAEPTELPVEQQRHYDNGGHLPPGIGIVRASHAHADGEYVMTAEQADRYTRDNDGHGGS